MQLSCGSFVRPACLRNCTTSGLREFALKSRAGSAEDVKGGKRSPQRPDVPSVYVDSLNRTSSVSQSGAHSLLAALLQNSTDLNASLNLDASLPVTSGRAPSVHLGSMAAGGLRGGNGCVANGGNGLSERSLSLFASGPMRVCLQICD
jgi:hypothetical protein